MYVKLCNGVVARLLSAPKLHLLSPPVGIRLKISWQNKKAPWSVRDHSYSGSAFVIEEKIDPHTVTTSKECRYLL